MISQRRDNKNIEAITVLQRKNYGCLAKIFCCKCIHACQDLDFSLLTSENRKEAFHKMIKKYIRKLHENKKQSVIMDPFFILVALLLGENSEIYMQLMSIINNQSEPIVFSKQDLEFYIPQLCTYLVFHQQLKNLQLEKLLIRACKVDIHFSLKYYFYMKSLEIINNGEVATKYERVSKYNSQFRNMINHYYEAHKWEKQSTAIINPLSQTQIKDEPSIVLQKAHSAQSRSSNDNGDLQNIRNSIQPIDHSSFVLDNKQSMNEEVKSNETEGNQAKIEKQQIKQTMINNKLKFLKKPHIYLPCLSKPMEFPKGLFESTINFFSDLVEISRMLVTSANREEDLKNQLQNVKKRLPATIYIPFTKDSYQDLNIINILTQQARVFKTKERAPFYICFQSFYNPTYNEGISRDKKIRSTSSLKNDLRKSSLFDDPNNQQQDMRQSRISIKNQKQKRQNQQKTPRRQAEIKQKIKGWSKYFNLSSIKRTILQKSQKEDQKQEDHDHTEKQQQIVEECQNKSESQHSQQVCNQLVNKNRQQCYLESDNFFGQSGEEQFQRIQKASTYSDLPGYKLIHVIIKSNDDLRQESYAMQLLQEFEKIFKMQKLPVQLSPYEVLPLSHEAGIMECVKDAITIDSLRKKGGTIKSLLNTKTKIKNFINSLAGYSLVTYFLQVKDRHNGNIMIKNDGSIFHIDYGFFMTNSPGKGVELQKNLPFKLTNEYVEALGGIESSHFKSFRLLFYKAFNACRKHQHRILILTKLMYSSYGTTMSCFIKGDQAIQKLEERFNPPGISNDAEISVYCQSLINSSIDNWRSRWYDKWQYYFQGILY